VNSDPRALRDPERSLPLPRAAFRETSEPLPLHSLQILGAPLDIWHDDPVLSLAVHRGVLIAEWHAQPFAVHVAPFARTLDAVCQRSREALGVVVSIRQGVKPGDEAMQQALIRTLKSHAGRIAGEAVVLEATGFQAAVFHGVISSMTRAMGTSGPRKVFVDLLEASSWLGERMQAAGAASVAHAFLREALSALRDFHTRPGGPSVRNGGP
jgi:hypothetical protein